MSKKDYELIAHAMRISAPRKEWLNKRNQWRKDCKELAHQMHAVSRLDANGNRTFKIERFLTACGLEADELQ